VEKIIPDTSVLINGALSRLIEAGEIRDCELIIPLAAVDELQAQASKGRDIGLRGLEEIKRIREISGDRNIQIRFSGERPSLDDIRLARSGRMDALIRDAARAEGGVLYTSDYVQALVAEAEGIPVKYIEPYRRPEEPAYRRYLGPDVVNLYLRDGMRPYAEVLKDGRLEAVVLDDEPCGEELLNEVLEEVMAVARVRENVDIVVLRPEAVILEMGDYRIRVVKPPLSDRMEAMIQRSILQLIPESAVAEPIIRECASGRRGVLVLNLDGVYSFPIAERVAERLWEMGLDTRIIGHARRVDALAPYYGPLDGDLEKTLHLALLSLPDYIIMDEVVDSRDLRLMRDARLAGVGLVAFRQSRSLEAAITSLMEVISPPLLSRVMDVVILMKCSGASEIWNISASVRAPSGLSPESGIKHVIELTRAGETVYEIYEVDGRLIISNVRELRERIEGTKRTVEEILRGSGARDARLEALWLDKAVIRVAGKGRRGLRNLEKKIMEDLGIAVEFRA
jgi:ATPase